MTKKNVFILLFDGYSDWEISYLTPELQKSEKIVLHYFSIDGANVRSMGGLNAQPEFSLAQIDPSQISVLVLPGGYAWENNSMSEIDLLVEQLLSENKTIAAICAATMYLAQKGYLDKTKHTSNALEYLKNFAENYSGAGNYQNQLAVTDKNIITANGIAPIEFAREIFKNVELYTKSDIEKWFQLFKNGIWTE